MKMKDHIQFKYTYQQLQISLSQIIPDCAEGSVLHLKTFVQVIEAPLICKLFLNTVENTKMHDF